MPGAFISPRPGGECFLFSFLVDCNYKKYSMFQVEVSQIKHRINKIFCWLLIIRECTEFHGVGPSVILVGLQLGLFLHQITWLQFN